MQASKLSPGNVTLPPPAATVVPANIRPPPQSPARIHIRIRALNKQAAGFSRLSAKELARDAVASADSRIRALESRRGQLLCAPKAKFTLVLGPALSS